MNDIEIYGIALLPIIVVLVQITKQFNIPTKLMPIIAILISEVMCVFFVYNQDGDIRKSVLIGLELGLASSGLYSSVKNMIK